MLNLRTSGDDMSDYCDMINEKIKAMWQEGENDAGVDVGDELKDLLRVYVDAEENLRGREAQHLETMTHCMKRYLEAKDERIKISSKLHTLKEKMKKVNNGENDE